MHSTKIVYVRSLCLSNSPELKPVIPEPEVVLRFPEVDKLAPPILQLSEVSNHNCGFISPLNSTHPCMLLQVTFQYAPGNAIFERVNLSADFDSRIALVNV